MISLTRIAKQYGRQVLFVDAAFQLNPGEKVGLVGPNGAGKTTLFRMITGQEQPGGGTLRLGETVQVGYVDQSRDSLDPDKTVWDEISGAGILRMVAKSVYPLETPQRPQDFRPWSGRAPSAAASRPV